MKNEINQLLLTPIINCIFFNHKENSTRKESKIKENKRKL